MNYGNSISKFIIVSPERSRAYFTLTAMNIVVSNIIKVNAVPHLVWGRFVFTTMHFN